MARYYPRWDGEVYEAIATPCLPFETLTLASERRTLASEMSEHAFLAAMLTLVGLEVLVLGYITYRLSRILEQVEGIGAATFLEGRKILSQPH